MVRDEWRELIYFQLCVHFDFYTLFDSCHTVTCNKNQSYIFPHLYQGAFFFFSCKKKTTKCFVITSTGIILFHYYYCLHILGNGKVCKYKLTIS